MQIQVKLTSDFICPWCFIADHRLCRAIEALPRGINVEILYLPFELNPNMPTDGMDRKTYRSAKFGSWDHSLKLDAHVVVVGERDGLAFDYERVKRTPNTFAAHRLVWLAQRTGDPRRLVDDLFRAYFSEGQDIGDPAVLAEIAAGAGLDRSRVIGFLAAGEGAENVRSREREAVARGIRGVPHLEIGETVVTGAQPLAALADMLRRAATIPASAGE